ncbi:MAG: hypothetical protein ACRDZ8_16380, partial [Acidimicrobiales bacterium]
SWRTGEGRWRHLGDVTPDGAEPSTPTVEEGYLLLSHGSDVGGGSGATSGDESGLVDADDSDAGRNSGDGLR